MGCQSLDPPHYPHCQLSPTTPLKPTFLVCSGRATTQPIRETQAPRSGQGAQCSESVEWPPVVLGRRWDPMGVVHGNGACGLSSLEEQIVFDWEREVGQARSGWVGLRLGIRNGSEKSTQTPKKRDHRVMCRNGRWPKIDEIKCIRGRLWAPAPDIGKPAHSLSGAPRESLLEELHQLRSNPRSVESF